MFSSHKSWLKEETVVGHNPKGQKLEGKLAGININCKRMQPGIGAEPNISSFLACQPVWPSVPHNYMKTTCIGGILLIFMFSISFIFHKWLSSLCLQASQEILGRLGPFWNFRWLLWKQRFCNFYSCSLLLSRGSLRKTENCKCRWDKSSQTLPSQHTCTISWECWE